jgi:diguanylate cyclase (GGDEF)-like protein
MPEVRTLHCDEGGAARSRVVRDMRTRRNFWVAMVVVLVAIGVAASVVGASGVARDDHNSSRQAFAASSANIASTLQLAIQHEQDLTISAGAFLSSNPDATQSSFLQWVKTVHAFARYPELLTISEISMVPLSQLGAFAARQEADPAGSLPVNGTFQVTPAGSRPYYCLTSVGQSRTAALNLPDGIDYCQTVLKSELLGSRDSGKDQYLPYKSGKTEELGVGTAIYRGGIVPSTVKARRASILGWTGTSILPGVILATALQGHAGMAVAFHYGAGSSKVSFEAGSAPARAATTSIDLSNGWHVQVFGTVTGAGILTNRNAMGLLFGGILFSVLLGLLFYLLATSRSRALALVHERTDELRHQAFHDSLTGLPNRALVLDRIDQMLAHARREHSTVAALFLDLDNFKDINDTLGHKAGDELLAGVGARLSGVLREGDTVGRLGGDEFVMLVQGSSEADVGTRTADRILAALEPPFKIAASRVPLSVTASIGIATGDRTTSEELIRDADIALYRAKAAGKNRSTVFTQSMLDSVDDRRTLDVDLHGALEADQFFLLYQPTIDLSSGALTGVEALLRWRHPTRGVVLPDDFVPALEASGLIVPVGQWVLDTACRQGAKWQGEGHRFVVSVNVAAKQLQRDRIVDDVYGALSASGFDPDQLVLELTESALVQDIDITVSRLQMLKAVGARLAIDDFGTGFSSLAYLQQFPIDILKIDRSFVSGMADTEKSAAIISTFVQLGKALGLEVIAEGVETDRQRVQLTAAKVDTGQGNLFALPLEVDAVDRMLERSEGVFERPGSR